jgi:hypothetical protein
MPPYALTHQFLGVILLAKVDNSFFKKKNVISHVGGERGL